ASSVHKAVGLLRQVLATAVADNLIASNAAERVELPTVRITEQRFLPAAELHRLALAAGERMPLVYVLGTTGLRFGEAAELRWRDVDIAGLRLGGARCGDVRVGAAAGHPGGDVRERSGRRRHAEERQGSHCRIARDRGRDARTGGGRCPGVP